MKYLLEHGIDNSQAAIRAIDIGVATQRISTGQAEMGAAVLKMRDSQLDRELRRLLGTEKENEAEFSISEDAELIDEDTD